MSMTYRRDEALIRWKKRHRSAVSRPHTDAQKQNHHFQIARWWRTGIGISNKKLSGGTCYMTQYNIFGKTFYQAPALTVSP
jgi:hypothetical protein